MSTFGTMVGKIRSDLNRGSDFDSRIKQAIESAINFYRARRLGFNMKRATTSTSSGTEYYALPTDFLEVDSLRVLDASNHYSHMREVSFRWIDERSAYQDYTNVPETYAVQNRELRLYPIPDDAYTLQMSFVYDLAGVSASAADAATNTWMTEGEELIRAHACADVLEQYIGGEESLLQAQAYRRRAAEAYTELKRRANTEQSSGRLAAWC